MFIIYINYICIKLICVINTHTHTQNSERVPFVSGCIQDVAQLIFKGQPSNTFEKHAPILFIKKEIRIIT